MSDNWVENTAYRWSKRALIVIGALGVLGAVALVLMVATAGWWDRRHAPARVEAAKPGRGFTIGNVTAIAGTPFVRIDISEGQGSNENPYSYSYAADDQRNVLMLDSRSGRSWRLLPDNERRIADTNWYPAAPTAPARSQPASVEEAATQLEAPTDPKSPDVYYAFLLAAPKGYDLVAGTIDGSRSATVMRGIDGLDHSWMRAPDQLAVIVRQGGRLSYRLIDMKTLRMTAQTGIAIE